MVQSFRIKHQFALGECQKEIFWIIVSSSLLSPPNTKDKYGVRHHTKSSHSRFWNSLWDYAHILNWLLNFTRSCVSQIKVTIVLGWIMTSPIPKFIYWSPNFTTSDVKSHTIYLSLHLHCLAHSLFLRESWLENGVHYYKNIQIYLALRGNYSKERKGLSQVSISSVEFKS